MVGLTYIGCTVFDEDDTETIIKAASGVSRPEVTALRIDSAAGTRMVPLNEIQINGHSDIFVVVDVPPYAITPLSRDGREVPGRLDVI